MNKKIVYSIIFLIVIAVGIVGFCIFGKERGEKEIVNENIIEDLQNKTHNTGFNFETKTVKLNSGYEMPINGIGTYSLTRETCYKSITSALNSGVRLIDTAYMYSNEEEIGRAIKDSTVPREEIFIITKLYPNQFDDPESAIEMAFEKLGGDYIDMMLYLIFKV